MSNQKSDDWLPEGWRVEVKVRRNGRKDKCYIPPSGGGKFYSRLEVCRFLNINHPKPVEKEKDNDHQSSKMVVVEKSVPNELPPGWIKEIKVTKKGHKIRRDSFYTDPVKGYVFRSMKGAVRYLESGNVGRLALKPKDKGYNSGELEDNKICTPFESKEQSLDDKGTLSPIISDPSTTVSNHPSNECAIGKESGSSVLTEPEEKGSDPTEGKSESVEDKGSDQTEGKSESAEDKGSGQTEGKIESAEDKGSDQTEGKSESAEDKGSDQTEGKSESVEDKGSDQTEGKRDSVEGNGSDQMKGKNDSEENKGSDQIIGKCESHRSVFDVHPGVGARNMESSEGGVVKDGIKRSGPSKTKKRKELTLPRRASKRLAGVPLDPTPELKTTNRTRRAAVKQYNEIIASTSESSSFSLLNNKLELRHTFETSKSTSMESNKYKHPIGNVDLARRIETEMEVDEKHGCAVALPLGNPVPMEHAGTVKTDKNADEKSGLPIDPSIVELWQDPCIAFAIKTLTGMPFDESENMKVSPDNEFGGLSTLEERGRKEDVGNGGDKRQGCTVVLPIGNLAIPEQHGGGVETRDKVKEKPVSPLGMPFADAWADPCIEFAIKTLTGAIPLEYDTVIQDYLPHQVSSSQQQDGSSLTLPNVGEFCQTEFLCQQYGSSEKALFNQSTLVEPSLPHTKNVNLAYSGGTSRRQHSNLRSKECRR